MQNINQIKRDYLLAIVLTAIFTTSMQIAFFSSSIWGLIIVFGFGGYSLYHYVYKFMNKLEDRTWMKQLFTVIEKVSTPAIIADLNYQISFANPSFNKLPLATLLNNVGNILDLISVQDTKVNITLKDALDGLKGKLKCHILWQGKCYSCAISPLYSPQGEKWGLLLECLPLNEEIAAGAVVNAKSFGTLDQANTSANYIHFEIENEAELEMAKKDIITNAIEQSAHPIAIIDENFNIQQTSNNFVTLINTNDKSDLNTIVGSSLLELVEKTNPTLTNSLEKALTPNKITSFVAEHFNQVCDWIITPITAKEAHAGYIIEIMYPSKQELKALEENLERAQQSKEEIETELRHFTQGLARYKLYQKGNDSHLEGVTNQDYQHPLIKNSSKIIYQLYSDLHNLHHALDKVKTDLQNTHTPDIMTYSLPLKQVNVLSNALSRNVYEAEQDLTALHQELSKLKSLLAEQKGLHQVYMKPLSRALGATEQALIKTVNHSETVTLILQQLYENQTFLTQLQEFIVKIAKLPRNTESAQTTEIYQDIILLLDRVRNTLNVGKMKLKELLINFDGLNNCWKQAQENLQSCLHSGTAIDQTSKRCSAMSNTAHDYSQLVQDKIAQLIEITHQLQEKTNSAEIVVESTYTNGRQFDKMVLEVDETKKKAEDVLLEGFNKY